MEDVNNGGNYIDFGKGGIWGISISSSQICYKSTTTLKSVLKQN